MKQKLIKTGFLLAGMALFLVVTTRCYKNEPVPTADFTFSGNNGFKVPCNVKFTNRSADAFFYDWFFGNDSVSSDTNPSHTYTLPGTYIIELRAYTESRNEWASKRKEVKILDTVSINK